MVVLDGGWNRVGQAEDVDAPRRLYYVAMTRAKQPRPLTLARLPGTNPFLNALGDVPAVLRRQSWGSSSLSPCVCIAALTLSAGS